VLVKKVVADDKIPIASCSGQHAHPGTVRKHCCKSRLSIWMWLEPHFFPGLCFFAAFRAFFAEAFFGAGGGRAPTGFSIGPV
jgi:hypothetical protein